MAFRRQIDIETHVKGNRVNSVEAPDIMPARHFTRTIKFAIQNANWLLGTQTSHSRILQTAVLLCCGRLGE